MTRKKTRSPALAVLTLVAALAVAIAPASPAATQPLQVCPSGCPYATIQAALKAGVSAYVVAGMQADRLQPILDVAVARFEREQALREELRDAQTKLVERKVVERAKGFLMQQKGVSDEEAYRLLRKLAMDRNARLLDVAQQVVDVAKLLG